MNLQMSLDWSDMTKGSIHGANGVVAADEQCTREPSRAGKRKERHQQRGACRGLQLLSRLDENLKGSRRGGFFMCLNFVGMDKNGPGGHCSG